MHMNECIEIFTQSLGELKKEVEKEVGKIWFLDAEL